MEYGKTTRFQDIAPSTAYRFYYIGAQAAGSGNVVDAVGSNDGVLSGGLADADCWANAGYFSSINGTDEAVEAPVSAGAYEYADGGSLIISFVINAGTIAANDGIFGSYLVGGQPGFRSIASTVDGLSFTLTDGTNVTALNSLANVTDSTDHTCTFMIDGVTGLCYTFLDGFAVGSAVAVNAATGSTASTRTLNFGNDTNTAAGKSYGAKWREAHMLVLSSGLPTNISEIAQLLASRRGIPLSAREVGI